MFDAADERQIRAWLADAERLGATHLIVVDDTFDHDDYPVYVMPDQDVREVAKQYDNVNMQRIMEVYSLALDKDMQIDEHRAFHWD